MDTAEEETQMDNDEAVGSPPSRAQVEALQGRLFSIGYSNHAMEHFLGLLVRAGVTALADVRTHPSSRRHPHTNRPLLVAALKRHGIAYVFLGDTLGGRPPDRDLYDADGRVDYERVRRTADFQRGLDRLLHGLAGFRVAMMCGEEDPLSCHRGLMITPALVERGLAPLHLRGDGSIETTEALERRLLDETQVGAGIVDGLFAATLTAEDHRDLLAQAYRAMARRKAFRLRPAEGEATANRSDEEDPQ
jgi:hypothetical protein